MKSRELASADLEQALVASSRVSATIRAELGEEAELDDRGRISLAYLTMCLEHREALVLLIAHGALTSATALQRPLLEACVTGAWIDTCSTDDELRGIASWVRPPSTFERMAQQLRIAHPLGRWFETLRGHYGILNDYAHGHRRQLSRWLGPGAVGPRYPDGQAVEMLRWADVVGLLAAVFREKVAGRPINALMQTLENVMDGLSTKSA